MPEPPRVICVSAATTCWPSPILPSRQRPRVELAAHILGPHRHVLLAVVRGMGASTWAGQTGLPHAEGMVRLRVALDALVRLEARDAG